MIVTKFQLYLIKGIACIFLLWAFGFVIFAIDTLTMAPFLKPADGIVVFTGGAGRIETAIRLLEQHHGSYLLISGVSPLTTLNDIENQLPHKIPLNIKSNITLGYNATSTMGNAIETAAWAHHYHLKKLIIVTSNYHIRRAIIELQNLLSNTKLYPYMIKPKSNEVFLQLSYIRLLFIEYNKFLGAYLGIIHTTHLKNDLLDPSYE